MEYKNKITKISSTGTVSLLGSENNVLIKTILISGELTHENEEGMLEIDINFVNESQRERLSFPLVKQIRIGGKGGAFNLAYELGTWEGLNIFLGEGDVILVSVPETNYNKAVLERSSDSADRNTNSLKILTTYMVI